MVIHLKIKSVRLLKSPLIKRALQLKILKQIKIEVPSLSEQDKIVKILDKLKKIIEMRNDELATFRGSYQIPICRDVWRSIKE